MNHRSEYTCGVDCPNALNWKTVAFSKLKQLNRDRKLFVNPGDVIDWNRTPELVVEGNRTVGGFFRTLNKIGRTRRRRFEEYIMYFPQLTTTRHLLDNNE